MTNRPTHAEVSLIADLSELHDAAVDLRADAKARDMPETAKQVKAVAEYIDATRTALIVEGAPYIDAALAALDTAVDRLAVHAAYIGRHVRRGARKNTK